MSNHKNARTGYLKSAVIALSLILSACGDNQQLPIGAELSISPTDRTLAVTDRSDENGNCIIDPNSYIDWPVVLQLTDGSGSPLGDIDIQVYVEFGANTFSGPPVMELYDDLGGNSNGVVDDFELVSGFDDDIAVVSTDTFGGSRALLLRANTSCPFQGEVFAFAQGVTASSSVNITLEAAE